MTDTRPIVLELFRHNRWANAEMLAACTELTAEQLATELPGTYGRLDQTLIHLARAQGGYVVDLTGWRPGPEHRLEYDEPFPGVERIARHLDETGAMLIEFVERADPDRILELVDDEDGSSWKYAEWVVLLQAAFHGTEHRQQIATILTHIGVQPPEPDVWAYWESLGGIE
jgi:uncharacterized damage-inducible protein DinB